MKNTANSRSVVKAVILSLFLITLFSVFVVATNGEDCFANHVDSCWDVLVEEDCGAAYMNLTDANNTFTNCRWVASCIGLTNETGCLTPAQKSTTSSSSSSTSSSSTSTSSSSSSTSTSSSSQESTTSSSSSSFESSSSSSSIFATTTLVDCQDNYVLACSSLDNNETGCEDAYTIYYEDTAYFYNCVYDGDTGYCDPVRGEQCTAGTNPECQDDLVYDCNAVESEGVCEASYIEGESADYNCYWVFGACYTGYQECDVVIDECNHEFTFGCPLINNSRDCGNAYSEFEGTYNCEWNEEWGCWFGDVCNKIVYEQCNSISTDDCYNYTNETACNTKYVEGREGYGWNCLWWDGDGSGCYYAESCHEGSPVTTTLATPMSALVDFTSGLPSVATALVNIVIKFLQVVLAVIILGGVVTIFDKITFTFKGWGK